MSILINKNTRVITQGITGKTGQFHTEKCQEYANGKIVLLRASIPKKRVSRFLGFQFSEPSKMQPKKPEQLFL